MNKKYYAVVTTAHINGDFKFSIFPSCEIEIPESYSLYLGDELYSTDWFDNYEEAFAFAEIAKVEKFAELQCI